MKNFISWFLLIVAILLMINSIFLDILNKDIKEKDEIIISLEAETDKAEIDLENMRDALAIANKEKEELAKKYDDALLTIQENNEVILTLTDKINTLEEEKKEEELPMNGTWTIGQSVPIPTLSTVRKQGTDYRRYNIAGSPHNRLQQVAWTDSIGCRRFNNDYIVALGSFYTEKIGDRFEITLANGNIFTIILGDGKDDRDTDPTHMYAPCPLYGTDEPGANLLEFIIDTDVMTRECYKYGGIDYYEEFRSDIVKMVYLGRDNSADWDTWR